MNSSARFVLRFSKYQALKVWLIAFKGYFFEGNLLKILARNFLKMFI